MNNIRRGFLYFISAALILFGMVGLFAPQIINAQVGLIPATIAGTCETRGLYGGGFVGFGVVIAYGLRCSQLARGLLLAMTIIIGGIIVGRLVSIGIDRELAFNVPAAIVELLIVLACWAESKSSATLAKQGTAAEA